MVVKLYLHFKYLSNIISLLKTFFFTDEHGVITPRSLGISDVWVLEQGKKVVCKFVNSIPAGDDADGLLSQFLGTVARDTHHFPISFQSWPCVPATIKEDVFQRVIKVSL